MDRARQKRLAWTALRFAITVGAVAWLLHKVDPAEALADLRRAPWWAFAAPILLLLGNTLLQAWREQMLLRMGGVRVGLLRVTSLFLQTLFIGQVLPRGGGELLRLAWLGRETGRHDVVLASLVVARALEMIAWGALLLYGLSWGVMETWPLVGLSAGVFAAGFGGVLVFALLAARWGSRMVRWIPVEPVRRQATALGHAIRSIAGNSRALLLPALLTAPVAASNVIAAWVVLVAYGLAMPLDDAFALIPAMDTLITLPISVGGIGLRENVFVYVFDRLGVLETTALAMSLTRWSGELARALLGGALFLVGDRLRIPNRAVNPAVEPEPEPPAGRGSP